MHRTFTTIVVLLALTASASAQWFGSSRQAYSAGSATETLTRLDGPHHYHTGTGCGCSMCFGNHLLGEHGQAYGYLTRIGYVQWNTLHDNLHNAAVAAAKRAAQVKANPEWFAPTPQSVVDAILGLVDPRPGEILYDLGSGDGRFLVTASKRYGCKTIGLEIDPPLVEQSRARIKAEGLEHDAVVYQLDCYRTRCDNADVVVVYLSADGLGKLLPRLRELHPGTRIATYAHALPGVPIQERWEYTADDGSKHVIYLYRAPIDRPILRQVNRPVI